MYSVIDLRFQDCPQIIAAYVVPGPTGVALVETGPGSTLARLEAGLAQLGLSWRDITDVLVTHIHLDHAGAAGHIARAAGARVYVHPVGAPHLLDPSRLLASARRLYGEQMETLWGEFVPVPSAQLQVVTEGEFRTTAGLRFRAVDTPGHARHHHAYLLDGLCFTGDIAGACLPHQRHIRLPTPPPDIDLEAWQASLQRLQALRPDALLLTHYGPVASDPLRHLEAVGERLRAVAAFVHRLWQAGESTEAMIAAYSAWVAEQAAAEGADADAIHRYEVVVPSFMEILGLVRYFEKGGR